MTPPLAANVMSRERVAELWLWAAANVGTPLPEALNAIECSWANVAFRLEQLDLAHRLQGELETKLAATQAALDDALGQLAGMRAALEEIAEGRGSFSRDQYEFACNVIAQSKAIATGAIAQPPSAQERLIAAERALAQATPEYAELSITAILDRAAKVTGDYVVGCTKAQLDAALAQARREGAIAELETQIEALKCLRDSEFYWEGNDDACDVAARMKDVLISRLGVKLDRLRAAK